MFSVPKMGLAILLSPVSGFMWVQCSQDFAELSSIAWRNRRSVISCTVRYIEICTEGSKQYKNVSLHTAALNQTIPVDSLKLGIVSRCKRC